VRLNPFLFRPRDVVRSKQSLHGDRKFHPRTGVGCEQFLADRYVQHAPKHPKLLVHRRRLERTLFPIATIEPDANPLFQPITKVFSRIDSCRNQAITLTIRVWPVWVLAQSRANQMLRLRNGRTLGATMILPGETEAGTAGSQPCRGISRWAHRDDERGREDSFLRRPTSIGSKDPLP